MKKNTKIGVLGGGQLSQMLCEAAPGLGIHTLVLAEDPRSPAARCADELIVGSSADEKNLSELCKRSPIVVFENEFVDCKSLVKASSKGKIHFVPSLEAIERLQDKANQKRILRNLNIMTAEFEEYPMTHDLRDWLGFIDRRFPGGFVLKWARYGYDGKGVFIVQSLSRQIDQILGFCQNALNRKVSVFAEKKIKYMRELAMVGCVSSEKKIIYYPLVISEQKDGICYKVMGPAVALGVDPKLENLAREVVSKIADHLDLVGCFAIEFFQSEAGELLVNEIAPRVHNSAHYTQEACHVSQFENHLRAAARLPLVEPEVKGVFAMYNLLGPRGAAKTANPQFDLSLPAGVKLHWYGKSEMRPGRKLGHLNAVAKDRQKLEELCGHIEKLVELWHSKLNETA
ncbi:MAG: 5-(carboxyamino)imidazole ribonucleotide synthase [Bdellovibrionota bacterium]